jgi:hypothetical protein
MSDILEIFGEIVNLQDAIDTLQVGIQEEDRLSVCVKDFHPDLQLLLTTIGMDSDTVVLTSNLTPKGTFYVNGPAIGKVGFKAKPEEILVAQTPGWFAPLTKVRELLSADDQSWKDHTLLIDLENGASARFPIYTTFVTKEEREKISAGQLIRGDLEKIKSVYFSYVKEEPKLFEPTTIEGVLALSDGKKALGFVKVGSPFTMLKDVPLGNYKVTRVVQEKGVTKEGKPFPSKKMTLISETGAIIETTAPRPISQLVRDSLLAVQAEEGMWFYKIELGADGKIANIERDAKQLQKALASVN